MMILSLNDDVIVIKVNGIDTDYHNVDDDEDGMKV